MESNHIKNTRELIQLRLFEEVGFAPLSFILWSSLDLLQRLLWIGALIVGRCSFLCLLCLFVCPRSYVCMLACGFYYLCMWVLFYEGCFLCCVLFVYANPEGKMGGNRGGEGKNEMDLITIMSEHCILATVTNYCESFLFIIFCSDNFM